MKNTIFLILIVVITGLVIACEEEDNRRKSDFATEKIEELKATFAPDKRVALFQVRIGEKGGRLMVSGETNIAEAKQALLDSLQKNGIGVIDSLAVLPSAELGAMQFGLVNNSVANIRSEARHSAELATQALLGTPLNVLKKSGEWYLVQTPDRYISWVDHGGLVLLDKDALDSWKAADKIIYTKVAGFSFSDASSLSQVVSDLVMGNVLVTTGEAGGYYKVQYPDGRTAFVDKTEANAMDAWLATATPTGPNLTRDAFRLMGAPYLWGGTSPKGMDCSGFTKTVYFMNGLVIPRDASQQVFAGQPVDTSGGWETMQPGDLLFFGTPATDDKRERVVHVGMWIGDMQFIHASGKVRVSSVDPSSELYDEFNTNRFLRARRYAPNYEGSIIEINKGLLF